MDNNKNKGQRNQEIKLYDFDEGDKCELNDEIIDYTT